MIKHNKALDKGVRSRYPPSPPAFFSLFLPSKLTAAAVAALSIFCLSSTSQASTCDDHEAPPTPRVREGALPPPPPPPPAMSFRSGGRNSRSSSSPAASPPPTSTTHPFTSSRDLAPPQHSKRKQRFWSSLIVEEEPRVDVHAPAVLRATDLRPVAEKACQTSDTERSVASCVAYVGMELRQRSVARNGRVVSIVEDTVSSCGSSSRESAAADATVRVRPGGLRRTMKKLQKDESLGWDKYIKENSNILGDTSLEKCIAAIHLGVQLQWVMTRSDSGSTTLCFMCLGDVNG